MSKSTGNHPDPVGKRWIALDQVGSRFFADDNDSAGFRDPGELESVVKIDQRRSEAFVAKPEKREVVDGDDGSGGISKPDGRRRKVNDIDSVFFDLVRKNPVRPVQRMNGRRK